MGWTLSRSGDLSTLVGVEDGEREGRDPGTYITSNIAPCPSNSQSQSLSCAEVEDGKCVISSI